MSRDIAPVTIVTGAGSGMGAAVARRMAPVAASLLLCDLDEAQLRKGWAAAGSEVETAFLGGDVSNPDFKVRLEDALAGRAVAGLVHCAGLSATMADPARILSVNLVSVHKHGVFGVDGAFARNLDRLRLSILGLAGRY
ncbi:SDR family NAD(P)-dependent oxidoreductase [Acidocella aquatica]|uniref:SDR family NAD(P)-dependent oxidoreductase n=1 Tax=Acidocella aquatica TaxID=1922313 RepID=UPI0024E077A8|nr:SDR family NAD(P)-dependent oxidoreductase [Acidocella aquatica]